MQLVDGWLPLRLSRSTRAFHSITRSAPGAGRRHRQPRSRIAVLALAMVFCLSGVAEPGFAQGSPHDYPRLANAFWQVSFDPLPTIEALSRWQVVVLNPVWTQEQLAQIRALNPDVRIFFLVNLYSMPEPQTTPDPWKQTNVAYAVQHDLFWYDVNGAIASDWPETWMVNITPWSATPPQGHWLKFFADRVVQLVQSRPDLDGVFFDNYWKRISWQQAWRQLDSDCNPTHRPQGCDGVADDNDALDALWNTALNTFITDLRARFDTLSVQRPRPLAIITNNSADYFESLNGTMREYFPSGHSNIDVGNPHGYNWWEEMYQFPGGYLVAPFRQTPYGLDILNAEWSGPVDAHAQSPAFERHKRFCLASTLLGDGYLSLDAGHTGHGSLWWEPEYDHAGRGTGYLGQPLGPARRILTPTGPQLLGDSSFDAPAASWAAYDFGAQGSLSFDAATFRSPPTSARVDIPVDPQGGTFKIWQSNLSLQLLESYTLRFWARSTSEQVLRLWISSPDCSGGRCLFEHNVALTDEWQRFETSFTSGADTDVASLDLFLDTGGSAWLDDVELIVDDTRLFQRDFENGIVLLNVTRETQLVLLEATLHRLHIPTSDVFDGAAVGTESLGPSDGRILLRQPPGPLPLPGGDPTDARSERFSSLSLSAGQPNPFTRVTRLHLVSPRTGQATARVFDVRGRLVRILWNGPVRALEPTQLQWDGRDDRGASVVPGTYLVRLQVGHAQRSRKLLLVR